MLTLREETFLRCSNTIACKKNIPEGIPGINLLRGVVLSGISREDFTIYGVYENVDAKHYVWYDIRTGILFLMDCPSRFFLELFPSVNLTSEVIERYLSTELHLDKDALVKVHNLQGYPGTRGHKISSLYGGGLVVRDEMGNDALADFIPLSGSSKPTWIDWHALEERVAHTNELDRVCDKSLCLTMDAISERLGAHQVWSTILQKLDSDDTDAFVDFRKAQNQQIANYVEDEMGRDQGTLKENLER